MFPASKCFGAARFILSAITLVDLHYGTVFTQALGFKPERTKFILPPFFPSRQLASQHFSSHNSMLFNAIHTLALLRKSVLLYFQHLWTLMRSCDRPIPFPFKRLRTLWPKRWGYFRASCDLGLGPSTSQPDSLPDARSHNFTCAMIFLVPAQEFFSA